MDYKTIVSEANQIFLQYQMALTLRQLFYRLVAKLVIPNTRNSYNYLSKVMVKARERRHVNEDYIEDRTRTTIGGDYGWESPEEYLNYLIDSLKTSDSKFTMPMWAEQGSVVEVWVEKDALSRVVSDIAQGFRTITCPSKGYSSYSYIRKAVKRMQGDYLPEQDIWILYYGDFDPSGKDIERDLTRRLRRYGAPPNFQGVKRIALTLEQIREHKLPPMPAKSSDPRFARFVADTGGTDVVELDALEPPVLQKIIRESINQFIDAEAWNKRRQEIDAEKQRLKEKLAKMKITFED